MLAAGTGQADREGEGEVAARMPACRIRRWCRCRWGGSAGTCTWGHGQSWGWLSGARPAECFPQFFFFFKPRP